MLKTSKVDEYGGQTGNEENSEDVTVTEERIVGEDGVERTVIRKTTTKKTVKSQQVTQGARVTTIKKTVYSSDGKLVSSEEVESLPEELDKLKLAGQTSAEQQPAISTRKSSSSSSEDEGFKNKIKSFFGGKSKPKKEAPAIKPRNEKKSESEKEEEGPKSVDEAKFAEECLQRHNFYREKHGAQPLKLSDKLCQFAKEWALNIAARDVLEHRSPNVYGENIFMKWTSDATFKLSGSDPVDNWYAEIKDHVFGAEPRSLKSGHFTQVVWKTSEQLGVAMAKSPTGKLIVVANYDPPGNVVGHFAEYVQATK